MSLCIGTDAYWHIFSFLGKKYVLDVESGSLHEIDDVLYDVLALGAFPDRVAVWDGLRGLYSESDIQSAFDDLDAMVSGGLLSPIEEGQRPSYASTAPSASGPESMIKALCLHIAHDCNLRCSYCFANTGSFGAGRSLMSGAVGTAAVDLLIRESGRIRNLDIDFFGGEPLLSFETVKQVTEYGRAAAEAVGKTIHFTLTTNAVLLDPDVIRFLDDHGVSVILSLDGRPETHDRWRKTVSGRGSYTIVAPKILAYVQDSRHDDYYVRGTYTGANLDFVDDIRHIHELGIDRISMEPVVGSPDEPWAIGADDLPKVRQEYERLVRYYWSEAAAGRRFEFFHFNLGLLRGQCHERRLAGCGAGHQYLAVTPDGDLYPCHQFVGRPEFRMGDVWSGVDRYDLSEQFRNANVHTKEGCSACWARYLCSGGCHAAAFQAHGSLLRPEPVSCAITRIRLEAALAAYARLIA